MLLRTLLKRLMPCLIWINNPARHPYDAGLILTGSASCVAAQRGAHATFEVDGMDSDRRSAWGVIVRGRLGEASEADYADLPEPLAGGERPYLIRLSVHEISGRRIPPEDGWARAMTGRLWSGSDASDLMG